MKIIWRNINFIAALLFCLIMFLKWERDENSKSNLICGRFPEERHITVDNVVWQVLEISENRLIKIMNAYLDDRNNDIVVRVNVLSPKIDITKDSIYCQFWYEAELEPIFVKAREYKILWWLPEHSIFLFPYFINCPVPKALEVFPTSVSLVANPCDYAENNLKIINNQPVDGVKKKFAVCYKSATYTNPNFTIKFIEWVHWMQVLGAEKIYFSHRYVHPKIFEAVKYFESQGIVETWPYYETSGIDFYDPNYHRAHQTWLLEQNSLNDCFYRIRNLYEYVAILDFDEILVPVSESDRTWTDLVNRIQGNKYDTLIGYVYLAVKNITESSEIPENLFTLRHLYFYNVAWPPGKSIFRTENMYIVNNHMSIGCLKGPCKEHMIDSSFARVYHYRANVTDRENSPSERIVGVMKYKDELIQKVSNTLAALS